VFPFQDLSLPFLFSLFFFNFINKLLCRFVLIQTWFWLLLLRTIGQIHNFLNILLRSFWWLLGPYIFQLFFIHENLLHDFFLRDCRSFLKPWHGGLVGRLTISFSTNLSANTTRLDPFMTTNLWDIWFLNLSHKWWPLILGCLLYDLLSKLLCLLRLPWGRWFFLLRLNRPNYILASKFWANVPLLYGLAAPLNDFI